MTTVEQISGVGNGRQNLIIPPSNNPSSNTYSFNGNNIIQFQLPNSEIILDPQSIRITGSLRFNANSAMTQGSAGDWSKIFQDPYLGINSVFRSVEFSSTGGNRQSIEKINNYGQLLNCILPSLNSTSDYLSENSLGMLASQNIVYGSDFFMRNASYYGDPTADPPLDGVAFGIRFSTPVYTGLTMSSGQKLPLGSLNGLTLTLELNSDGAVFVTTEDSTAEPDKFARIKYELFDLKLECETYSPTAAERVALLNNPTGTLMCNTFTSLFSVLQASNTNTQFNLGINELVAVLFKFNPTSAVNNIQANEFQATRVISDANLVEQFTKVRFMRSGTEFPLMFPINVVTNSDEAELSKYYLQALKNVHSKRDPKLAINNSTNDPRFAIGAAGNTYTLANAVKYQNKQNTVYGVGYDFLKSMSGADFNGKPLTINVECNLADGRTNAMYAFVLAKTMIRFNENGVMVMN